MMEFHISRAARDRYQIKEVLFSFNGNAVFANPAACRTLAHRINQVRGAENDPKRQVHPGAFFAMGLIDEAAHAVMAHYRQTVAPNVMEDALVWFGQQVGTTELEALLLAFVEQFPGTEVYSGRQTPIEWLKGQTDGMSHRAAAFEELLMLWFENQNPLFAPYRELFDDTQLKQETVYGEVTERLPEYFALQPPLGPDGLDLVTLLLSVFEDDGEGLLGDQLTRLRKRWGFAVGELLRRILLAGDVLKEEEVALWLQFHPPTEEELARRQKFEGFQNAKGVVPTYSTTPEAYENFSPDQEWMPRTVMIAKSTYVWLWQLSKRYGREITRLDQIPDEELQTLANRGMNALWLIGIWERSRASQTIKRLCGNPEAVASAYSLFDYSIAHNLGGDAAYNHLRERSLHYGLRLASDMVPNHMGIDSTWVNEHPEWFLSRSDSPYPAYSFEGPDLGSDDRVEIKIEDHYFSQTDAAVVFRRRDKWTGDIQYVYHGNDGTSFPWNDTAQLNYRSAAVREQVIQTILHVARMFPIIRFDAAMTLAKVHVQRLWFPTPGSGGSIPSRAESSMTTEEFDAALPNEFWREVVDRVAHEVPGTLLLAEAFWLMEGYFVRTLGMHRVYNSAFMVMLRDEDNANYRKVLKNTLEFDPGIMKRYVNFMSNPDERTAIDQFGSGDKYFGVATMMATLPGLPMFGHGQVEGYTEKYGMEYYKPRYDEVPNDGLVDRHNREIAPLLHSRATFAESDHFLLYDFWKDDGSVDENVFAYSNRNGDQRAVIVYHNHYGDTRGTIHRSAAYMDKWRGELRQQTLEEALALPNDPNRLFAYRESASNLTYLRRSSDIVSNGLRFDLHAYQYSVFIDWQEKFASAEQAWDRLCDQLAGQGVPDLDTALINLELAPLHNALRGVLDPALVRHLAVLSETMEAPRTPKPMKTKVAPLLPEDETLTLLIERGVAFLEQARAAYLERLHPAPAIKQQGAEEVSAEAVSEEALLETRLRERLHALLRLPTLEDSFATAWPLEARSVLPSHSPRQNAGSIWAPALAWSLLAILGESLDLAQPGHPAIQVYESFRLRAVLAEAFSHLNFSGEDTWRAAARVRIALDAGVHPSEPEPAGKLVKELATLEVPHTSSVATVQEKNGVLPSESASLTTAPKHIAGQPASFWADGDRRWLTGVHDAGGKTYFNKESYEELVWWKSLPALMQLAAQQPVPERPGIAAVEARIEAATGSAKAAGYQLPVPGWEAEETSTEPSVRDTVTHGVHAQAPAQAAPLTPAVPRAKTAVKGKSAEQAEVVAVAEAPKAEPAAAKKAAKKSVKTTGITPKKK